MNRTFTLLVALAACDGAPTENSQSESDHRVSVVLITLDTTRADHLGPYGYALAETPVLDGLAARGTTFERAYSSAPLTIPSHSTMFTGRFPPSHGVRDNGDFVLPEEAVTLAERFQAAGYTTAAFPSAFPTNRRWGFAQGFDIYRDPMVHDAASQDWRDQRPANEVIDDALRDLRDVDGPVFAWIHLFDAHWPYEPPEPFASRHPGRPYDGEIAFADSEVGRFLDWFEDAKPNHVITVTADHGESLGDGGEQTHGFLLHDGTLHVPLLVKGTSIPQGMRVDDPVGHPDLAPTLLRLAGLPMHEGLQGRDLFEGGSDAIYSEALTGQFNLGLAPLYARTAVEGRYTEGGWGGFYPHHANRIGTEPTRRDDPELAERLATMRATLDEVIAPTTTLDSADLEMLTQLGYLGTGDVRAAAGEVDPRDVIDVIPLTWRAREAVGARRFQMAQSILDELETRMPNTFGVKQIEAQLLRARGDHEGALEALVDLYLSAPSSTLAQQIGDLYLLQGSYLDAEDWYTTSLEHLGNSPRAMGGLVRVALALGDIERARELANRFLVVYPDHAELNVAMAEILLTDRRPRDALTEARIGLEHLPWSSWSLTVAARAHWELGEPERAIDLLRQAQDVDPLNVRTRALMVSWLIDVKRAAEAVRTIRPFARMLPDDPEVQRLYQEAMALLDAERRR
jgi:tetratricopeptide (TPR) repeat protein